MPLPSIGLQDVAKIQARLRRTFERVQRTGQRPWARDTAQRSIPCPGATPAPLPGEPPKLSIVIPALNEAEHLGQVLRPLQTATNVEVIVVDGGSVDATPQVAAAWGSQVVVTAAGRSQQQNQGAALASGSLLLFLHADTRLPPGFDQIIRHTLAQPGVVAGAFRLAINGPSWGRRWVEWGVNLRSRYLHMPYGDQGIFLTADTFQALGGFPDLPMMEDFELMRRLRRQGRVAIAPQAVVTSDRRWQRLGIFRTTLANQIMIGGYLLGIDPHRLARWYRNLGKPR
jgi:rSAM/selenodomain-associated transferase 2